MENTRPGFFYFASESVGEGHPDKLNWSDSEAAASATKEIPGQAWVVKAQVHAGGRGKAGGVKIVKSSSEAQSVANSLLGKALVTYQNAPDGQPVHQLLVEQTLPIARELYLSQLVDRGLERVVMVWLIL